MPSSRRILLGPKAAQALAANLRKVRDLPANPARPERPAQAEPSAPILHDIRVTSATATDGRYPGKLLAYDPATKVWSDVADIDIWVVDLNDGTPAVRRYRGRFRGPAGSPERGVYSIEHSGGLTVEEQDGSPTYSAISTLRYDQADGFVITNPSAGVARIDLAPASATQAGIVSLGTQTLGTGTKTVDDLIANGGVQAIGNVVAGATSAVVGNVQMGQTDPGLLTWSNVSTHVQTITFRPASQGTAAAPHGMRLYADKSSGAHITELQLGDGAGTSASGKYCTWQSGTLFKGVDGTFTTADGKTATVKGGVITNLV